MQATDTTTGTGTTPGTPAGASATPAAVPATPAAVPATPAAVPATPAGAPATLAGVPATPAGASATPAAVPATPAAVPATDANLAGDLYALIVFLHKNCNSDLFEAVGALELTLTQIKLLHHLEDQQPRELTLKEAAELVHVSLPAASRMVDDLVRRGFAQRREDLEDRRMKRVCLTSGGRAVISRLNAARLTGLVQFTETLTITERRLLAEALSQLLEREDVAACRLETPAS